MASNEPFGFDPEDLQRVVRSAGEQLQGVFGRFFEGSGEQKGWSGNFGESGRRPRSTPEQATTGDTGAGVWAIYTVGEDGSAQIEQVYATELDALRANKHNTDSSRKVRFLPYGIAVSAMDTQEDAPGS